MRYQLAAPYLTNTEAKYLSKALSENWISSKGKNIIRFERETARYIGLKYGIAASNGTAALHLALLALGIGKGDEVIVPGLTFAATINSIIYTGAVPVIADIEKDSWCISPSAMAGAVTSRTRAVIAVHLYGQPCPMNEIMRTAAKNGIYVIEDCAESIGAEYAGRKIGSFGNVGCFSFYGNKIVTTGEGGMCITGRKDIAEKMAVLRNQGMNSSRRYWHDLVGYNYRMTNLQASVGLAQLEKIDVMLAKRVEIEDFYLDNLKDINCLKPQRGNLKNRKKVTWLVSYQFEPRKLSRDQVAYKLLKEGVETRNFFYPLSEMPVYRKYVRRECPVSQEISRKGINFPTNLNLRKADYRKITGAIKKVCAMN